MVCRHNIEMVTPRSCTMCSRNRDDYASYRRADGAGRFVKPYAQLPSTARDTFLVSKVKDVVAPLTPADSRQWRGDVSDFESEHSNFEGDLEREKNTHGETPEPAEWGTTQMLYRANVPQWYEVYERGATPTWPDPEAYDRDKYLAEHRERCEWGPVDKPGPGPYIRGLVMHK